MPDFVLGDGGGGDGYSGSLSPLKLVLESSSSSVLPLVVSCGGQEFEVSSSSTLLSKVEQIPVQKQGEMMTTAAGREDASKPSECVVGDVVVTTVVAEDEEQLEEMEVDDDVGRSSGVLFALCGYRHCASEAVRYLVEEENLDPDDPIVVGLWNHLLAVENHHLNSILDEGSDDDEEEEEEEEDEGFHAGSPEQLQSDPREFLFQMTRLATTLAVGCRSSSPETSSHKWASNVGHENYKGESSSSRWVAPTSGEDGDSWNAYLEQQHLTSGAPTHPNPPCSPTPSI